MTKSVPHGLERVVLSNERGERALLTLTWLGRKKKT